MIGGAKGIGLGIDLGLVNQYNRTGSQSYIEPEVLDSLVGVWSAYGMTNDSPNRSTIKNKLSNKGGDFVISNAAFKLNSGFGKYSADFESFDWTVNISQKQHNKATISLNGRLCNHAAIEVDEMKVNIIGNVTELIYWYIANPDDTTRSEIRLTSGINTLPKSYAKDDGQTYNIGFAYISGDSEITIEQIPPFEGAFVTDGIDDLITSTKTVREMLGGSDEITVVSMIHQINANKNFTTTNNLRNENRVIGRNTVTNIGKTGIYGWYKKDIQGTTATLIDNILGDKNDYTGHYTESTNSVANSKFYVTGYAVENGFTELSSVAWYWTIIANKVLTTDQINQVIAYFNLDRTLKSDIYCNIAKQGITNENHAEFGDKLIDFSGNGRDIQMYNLAWNKESGIDDDGALRLDGVNDFGKVTGMPIYKDYTFIAERAITNNRGGIVSKIKDSNNYGAFILELDDLNYSFNTAGTRTTNVINDRKITYLSKYVYNGENVNVGNTLDSDIMWLGKLREEDQRFSNIAIYSLMSFPYSMSEFLIERQLKKHKLGTLYPDMVEWRPIIKSNVEYGSISYLLRISGQGTVAPKIGQYYPILSTDTSLVVYVATNGVDEVANLTINGQEPTSSSIHIDGRFKFEFPFTKSPQKINITIDEYVRFEDIVQPYPVLLRFKDESGKEVSWGGKLKVGSTITRIGNIADPESNLLNGLYSINGLTLNGKVVTSSTHIVEKQMVFKTTATYLLDDNEPKCILSPRLLRIPNSSYKILGYIPDISGHGNNGVIHNSAYAGMSGADGYVENFNNWTVSKPPVTVSTNEERIRISYIGTSYKTLPIFEYSGSVNENYSLTVEIQGIPDNVIGKFIHNNGFVQEVTNGINTIRFSNSGSWYGFTFYREDGSIIGDCNITIKQIGEYEGAFCLDGVDDSVTIPTLSSGGRQVLMKVNWWGVDDGVIYDQRDGTAAGVSNQLCFSLYPDSIAYQFRNVGGKTFIDGILNNNIVTQNLKGITHNITSITNHYISNSSTLFIGANAYSNNKSYVPTALYDFMLFDNISTDDKIKELNEYVGIEAKVELPPYYWDAYGKTNSSRDKATIQQRGVAVGNYDLTNNNFAYDKMSGFGGYEFAKFDNTAEWIYTNNSDTIEVVNRDGYSVVLRKVGNGANYWHFRNTIIKSLGQDIRIGIYANNSVQIVWQLKYKLEGDTDYNSLAIASPTIEGNINTYVTLPYKTEQEIADLNAIDTYYSIYFIPIDLDINEEVTIEMLPLYPNGLVYDGVTDYSNNNNIPALTDYTCIFKRDILGFNHRSVSMHKGTSTNAGRAFTSDYDYGETNEVLAYSFGSNIATPNATSKKIIYGTKTSVDGQPITPGSNIDDAGLFIGKWYDDFFKKMVFYKLILYPKTIPLLQINFLKNLMERDEIIDLNNKIFIQE